MSIKVDNKTEDDLNDILVKAIKVSAVLLGINYAFRAVNRPRPITHNVHIYVHTDWKDRVSMSLNVRYLTNGETALYCVSNTGVVPAEYTVYKKLEDIPESIRHYAPAKPKFVSPETAQSLGFGPDLYPEFEGRCLYNKMRTMACLGSDCSLITNGECDGCIYWKP